MTIYNKQTNKNEIKGEKGGKELVCLPTDATLRTVNLCVSTTTYTASKANEREREGGGGQHTFVSDLPCYLKVEAEWFRHISGEVEVCGGHDYLHSALLFWIFFFLFLFLSLLTREPGFRGRGHDTRTFSKHAARQGPCLRGQSIY